MYKDTLTEAILSQDIKKVKEHLSQSIDLEELDVYGFTPLIEATIANSEAIIKLLLIEGANVNTQDITGRTALHWAVDNHHLAICELLLKAGANSNAYTYAGQPVLVLPYLRQQQTLKDLLYRYQGQLSFAQDFIKVKVLGHRYELSGQADIIDPQGQFVAIDYEGFFLEFVIEIIRNSLKNYTTHFAARDYRKDLSVIQKIIQLFKCASNLLQYQKYTINIQQVSDQIDQLLATECLLLPIAYEGHAISFIYYQNLLVRCDRGENSQKEGSIVIYRIQKPERWTPLLIKQLLYERQSRDFIVNGIKDFLALKRLAKIPMTAQLVGNCSWANIEASVLVLFYMLRWDTSTTLQETLIKDTQSIKLYEHWLSWDKARALEDCIKSFEYATPARKATLAMMLGAVLFQSLDYQRQKDVQVGQKLVAPLMTEEYQYILKSYLKIYWHDHKTQKGHNLMQLLNLAGAMPLLKN